MVNTSTRVSLAITGNNIRLSEEIARRTVTIRLEPSTDRPQDTRHDIDDLEDYCLRHRPRLLSALLTIMRAFRQAADKPATMEMGGFSQWRREVAAMPVWLGLPDPVMSMMMAVGTSSDPEVETTEMLFDFLLQRFGTRKFIANEVIGSLPQELAALVIDKTGMASTRLMSELLISKRGVVIDGHKLTFIPRANEDGKKSRSSRFYMAKVGPRTKDDAVEHGAVEHGAVAAEDGSERF
jgi:hypothetical protein